MTHTRAGLAQTAWVRARRRAPPGGDDASFFLLASGGPGYRPRHDELQVMSGPKRLWCQGVIHGNDSR
jgi:hypothetical protein